MKQEEIIKAANNEAEKWELERSKVQEIFIAGYDIGVKNCSIPDVSNCGDDVEKVIVDRGTLQWMYNYVQKKGDGDETVAIIKHLESLGCVYK